jgi:U4/U6.U5 tri-snRNP-associated protein 2
LKLPKNLVLFFKRFEKNAYFTEKNPTIVTFPLKNLSLEGNNNNLINFNLLDFCTEETKNKDLKYDLLANVIHDGKPEQGTFRAQVKHKSVDKWFDIQDLTVNNIMPQSVVVSESYIHVYDSHK